MNALSVYILPTCFVWLVYVHVAYSMNNCSCALIGRHFTILVSYHRHGKAIHYQWQLCLRTPPAQCLHHYYAGSSLPLCHCGHCVTPITTRLPTYGAGGPHIHSHHIPLPNRNNTSYSLIEYHMIKTCDRPHAFPLISYLMLNDNIMYPTG